jgi:hypothetical protein
VILAIAIFTIAIGSYTTLKAYRIGEKGKVESAEQRYELEKDFYLVSTVGWITLLSRIVAIPLFFITVISLIPSVPGAMCEFGVFQAGSPYSWVDFGLKLVTVFAFGGWLFIDFVNRKLKGTPLMGSLSRSFVLLTPLLYLDAFLDLIFFGSLKPVVVPCCMVVYSPEALFSCPFCLVTFQMPLLLIAIPAFILAAALIIWSTILRRFFRDPEVKEGGNPILKNALLLSISLVVIGVVFLMVQIVIGPIGAKPLWLP